MFFSLRTSVSWFMTGVFRVRTSVLGLGQVLFFSLRTNVFFSLWTSVLVFGQVFYVIGQLFLVKDKCLRVRTSVFQG